jgi:hypothetical protein
MWLSQLQPGWRLVTKVPQRAVRDQIEQGAVRRHDSTGMNWGREERLSPALILPGLPQRGLPSLGCDHAVPKNCGEVSTLRDGENEARSQIPKVLAGVSHLVGASQGVVDARPCCLVQSRFWRPMVMNVHRPLSSPRRETRAIEHGKELGLLVLLLSTRSCRVAFPKRAAVCTCSLRCSIETRNLAASLEQTLPPHKPASHCIERCN